MSSYHSSFTYLGINSEKDKNLVIAEFDANNGEQDSFLSSESVYTESYNGAKRLTYGSKYDSVAQIKITLIKPDGSNFSIDENRDILRWLSGVQSDSALDLYVGDKLQYTFICKPINIQQYKMDARVIGLIVTFESVSPYAYTPVQTVSRSIIGTETFPVQCETDDLYSSVYIKAIYENNSGSSLTIENNATGEIGDKATKVTNIRSNEIVTIDSNMIITSQSLVQVASVDSTTSGIYYIQDESNPGEYIEVLLPDDYQEDVNYYQLRDNNRIFGNDFNFIFPRLVAGTNDLTVTANGTITFEYRCPLKVGDCAIDVAPSGTGIGCGTGSGSSGGGGGTVIVEELSWENITNKPTTIAGFGITDAYTMVEIDRKLNNILINIDEQELNAMLAEVLV